MDTPLTAFEARGHVAPWTSRTEEDAFVSELLSATDAITMTVVGSSVDGAPMRLFRIGNGKTRILLVAQQHGAELAGREALYTMLRDWADTDDSEARELLTQATVLVMPTCHPDNLTTRENLNGVNLNRDHVQLTQPETQAIHAVIRDWQPHLIVDCHEGQNISNDVATAPAYNLNADSDVLALSEDLHLSVKASVQGEGHTWELYQGPNSMMRGAENLHNNAAVNAMVSLLIETRRTGGDDSDAGVRYQRQRVALDSAWRWCLGRQSDVVATVEAARGDAAGRADPVVCQVETNVSGPTVDPVPVGYIVSPAGWAALAAPRALHGITGQITSMGGYIPTAQRTRTLIVYLIDASSPQALATGTAASVLPDRPAPAAIGTPVGYRFRAGGVTRNAIINVKAPRR